MPIINQSESDILEMIPKGPSTIYVTGLGEGVVKLVTKGEGGEESTGSW